MTMRLWFWRMVRDSSEVVMDRAYLLHWFARKQIRRRPRQETRARLRDTKGS